MRVWLSKDLEMGRLSWMISCVVIRILLRGRQASQGRRCDNTQKSEWQGMQAGVSNPGHGPRLVFGLLETWLHSRRWMAGERGKFCLLLPISPHRSNYHLNHDSHPLPTHSHTCCPWKNCLPQNWSLLPKMLGTAALADRKREEINSPLESSGRPQPCWPILDFWTSKLFSNTLV